MKSFLGIYRFFRPDQSRLVLVFALMFLGTGLFLLKPWPIAFVVDSILGSEPLPAWLRFDGDSGGRIALVVCVCLTFVIHLAVAGVTALHSRIAIAIGLNGLQRVRALTFEQLQRLPLTFLREHRHGDIIQRVAWDTCSYQTMFQHGLITGVTAGLSLLLMIIVMAQLNIRLTLVSLVSIPFMLLAIRMFGRQMSQHSAAAQEADSELASRTQQNVAAASLIRSFNREDTENRSFAEQAADARDKRFMQHSRELTYLAVLGVVFGGGVAAILWIGAQQVVEGHATVGELIVFLTYLAQFYEPLNQLSNIGSTLSAASAGVNRVNEILDSAPPASGGKSMPRPLGDIEFKSVTFGFAPDRPILRELSLTITAGETVALVGPSGTGKSTLLSLLQRFNEPTSGTISIGAQSLAETDPADLRRRMSSALQEPALLPGSIRHNIALGTDADQSQIESAARAARAHEFIGQLESRYDTCVGDGSARLSVGESQRINLARLFLRDDSELLLLDEPTSALDTENEAAVAESLAVLGQGRTCIFVTHRPAMLKFAKRIIVMEAGRIVADGTVDEVAEQSDFFRHLMNSTAN